MSALMHAVREHAGEETELLEADSAALGRARAAVAVLGGGLRPDDVAAAVRRTGARIVHAHNLLPQFGARALEAAQEAGARVVLHLHNYRLVCAVGTCFTEGQECTRCHGRRTLPGLVHRCRGGVAEPAVYAAGIAAWQRRLTGAADAVAVPSAFGVARLRALGAPLPPRVEVLPHPVTAGDGPSHAAGGSHALLASRLAPEKECGVAIEACMHAGVPLVVAGDGPERDTLERLAAGADVSFVGHVDYERLDALRAASAIALCPTAVGEIFGLAAAEAMADGVPVVAGNHGAHPELVPSDGLAPLGDPNAWAAAIGERFGDAEAGERGRTAVRERCDPPRVAAQLAELYDAVCS